MAITDLKFNPAEFKGQDIASLPDRPQITAAELKARFDNIGKMMIALGKHNELIDYLSQSGADGIGAEPVVAGGAETVQGILKELQALCDAIDAAVVHKAGYEVIEGSKRFANAVYVQKGVTLNSSPGYDGSGIYRVGGDLVFESEAGNSHVFLRLTPSFLNEPDLITVSDRCHGPFKVWHEGNDGHNSGLDADTLDGKQGGDYVDVESGQTITGAKEFSVSPTVPFPTLNSHAATKHYVDKKDVTAVHKTGNEAINGVKMFRDHVYLNDGATTPYLDMDGNRINRVAPPVYSDDAATKGYVDDNLALHYTKDNLQTAGQATVHWGNLTNIPNLADASWKSAVAVKADLPVSGNTAGDQRVVLNDGDSKSAVYVFDKGWKKVGDVDWASEEQTRITQENERVSAENERALAEQGRVSAEGNRVTAEQYRVKAEQERDAEYNGIIAGFEGLSPLISVINNIDGGNAFNSGSATINGGNA